MPKNWWTRLTARRLAPTAPVRRIRPGVEALDDRAVPAALYAVASEPGSPTTVTVFDAATNQSKFTLSPFDSGFTGGARVALGDVNADGTADIIVGAGAGGGPLVFVYNGLDGALLQSRTVGDADGRGGATVAAGDIDRDGAADIVVGSTRNGQPMVQVLSFEDGPVLRQYSPFAGSTSPNVAVGDVNGDGRPDVIVGSGAGGGPRVIAYDGSTGVPLLNFFAFEETFTGGVNVAAADLDADGKADIIAAAGVGGGPRVQVFSGATGAVLSNFFAYDSSLRNGVNAGAADVLGSGKFSLVTTNGPGQAAEPKAFDPTTGTPVDAATLPPGVPSILYDTIAPTATVTSTSAASTTDNPIPFTVTFSEPVSGFSAAGLTVTNGTLGAITTVDARTYTFSVTPTVNGTVSVEVNAGAASDPAGNQSTATAAVSRTFTGFPGAPAITSTATGPTNLATIPVTVTFSADVTGFVLADIQVANGTAGNFKAVNARTFTVDVTPTADGTVTVTVPANAAAYVGGGVSTAATFSIASVRSGPTATISATDPATSSPIIFTVKFSKEVSALTASGLAAANGTIGAITKTDATTYRVPVTPGTGSPVTLTLKSGAVSDTTGNSLVGDVSKSVAYQPTVDAGGLTPTIPDVNAEGFRTTASGLKIKDVVIGTGTAIKTGERATVQYSGWLLNGTRFDSSVTRGEPSTFSLSGVIKGWQEGVPGMQPGGVRQLVIPAALAYGSSATSSIPANSDLVFEIKLISVG